MSIPDSKQYCQECRVCWDGEINLRQVVRHHPLQLAFNRSITGYSGLQRAFSCGQNIWYRRDGQRAVAPCSTHRQVFGGGPQAIARCAYCQALLSSIGPFLPYSDIPSLTLASSLRAYGTVRRCIFRGLTSEYLPVAHYAKKTALISFTRHVCESPAVYETELMTSGAL